MVARTKFDPKPMILPLLKCLHVSLYEKCQKHITKRMKPNIGAPRRALNALKVIQNPRILDKTRTKSPFVGTLLLSIKYEENAYFRCFIDTRADLLEKTRIKSDRAVIYLVTIKKHSRKYMQNAHATAATTKKM